jgi:hypothetical protein
MQSILCIDGQFFFQNAAFSFLLLSLIQLRKSSTAIAEKLTGPYLQF